MKKNISINISGIIFHIEEDGYDQLKNYLDSISLYFSSFEDSKEIIADIENRIAEIFTTKLTEYKQVITQEDVVDLITTMGTVSDFKAIEEDDKSSLHSFEATNNSNTTNTSSEAPTAASKRLYRDGKRKILGGVAAGIANHLKTDPLWIRLILVALFLGLFFIPPISGLAVIAYIVLWMVLPESIVLDENETLKKLYRNPEERVIGGVCSGLAAYFGSDVTLFRFIFVTGIFLGGSTLVLYLILWIITPEAHSITDKIRMQGEPVTLTNIEQNIKKNLNIKEDDEETTFTKILLFPFRVIAMIFTALGRALGPLLLSLGEIVRVLLGVALITITLIVFSFLIMSIGAIYGIADTGFVVHQDLLPLEVIINSIPRNTILSVFLLIAIPVFSLGLIGASVLAKRRLFHPLIGWTLTGLFIISVIITAYTLSSYLSNFKKEAKLEKEETYPLKSKSLKIEATEHEEDMEIFEVDLIIKGHPGPDIKIIKEIYSRGKSRSEATQNAEMIQLPVQIKDSTLFINQNYSFRENAVFRFQRMKVTILVPYGKEFEVGEGIDELLRTNRFDNHSAYLNLEANKWVFERNGIKCIDCYEEEITLHENFHDGDDDNVSSNTMRIQAERYSSMYGVEIEETHDVGGGQNVGFLNPGDWMAYKINIPADGLYTIRYRVASFDGMGRIRVESLGGTTEFGTLSIPKTGGWQNWVSISHTVHFEKGPQEIAIVIEEGEFNLNWFSISPKDSLSKDSKVNTDIKEEKISTPRSKSQLLPDKSSDENIKDVRLNSLTNFTALGFTGLFFKNIILEEF